MISAWLSTQPERVRAVLDPSCSPVRAAVVLAARHEQEAVASLDEFLWFEMLRYERAQARIAELESQLAGARSERDLAIKEMASARRLAQEAQSDRSVDRWLGSEKAHDAGGLFQKIYLKCKELERANVRGQRTLDETKTQLAERDAEIAQLRAEREVLMTGTPPEPPGWIEAMINEGAATVAPNGQVMVGGLLNDPRLP